MAAGGEGIPRRPRLPREGRPRASFRQIFTGIPRKRPRPAPVVVAPPPKRVIPQAPLPRVAVPIEAGRLKKMTPKPGDQRGFVHKRLIRGAIGLATGGPGAAVGGFLAPTTPEPPPVRRPAPRTTTARPSAFSAAEKESGRRHKFASFGPSTPKCFWPMELDPVTNRCVRPFAGSRPGPDPTMFTGVGDAVMGQYGAGLEPGSRIIDRAVCLRGMVLGDDGICYNRSQISNRERMWPKGRRPLLTGGDMRAISTAARAGKRLEGATKRLQKIGLMKKPPPRRKVVSGPTEHHHH